MDTQVLVVGGGPVGLTLAIDLGRRGVRCTLIEQKEAPQFLPKMERCNARTMEIFRRMGIADLVGDSHAPEDFHGARIAPFHLRQKLRCFLLLDQRAAHAASAEIDGEGKADRAAADDEYLCVHRSYSALPAECEAALAAMEFATLGGPDPKTAVGSQLESSFPHRSKPARGAHKAPETEKMDSGDRRTARTRNVPYNDLRAGFDQKTRNRLGSRLQRTDRVPDSAQHRESEQAGQARRPRKPDAHRKFVFYHLRRPHADRLGLETELRPDLPIETCPSGTNVSPGQRSRERGFRYLGMAFGVTRHAHMRDAVPLEQARLEQPEARLERPARPVAVAGDHQSAVDARLACYARQVFVERVAAGDPACRDVRNRSKAGAFQPRRQRHAPRIGLPRRHADVDGRPRLQEVRAGVDLHRIPRRQFERSPQEESLNVPALILSRRPE